MYEVEVKLSVQHDVLRPKLLNLGFEPAGTYRQVDHYFSSPVRDFAITDEALRVRELEPEGTDVRRVELTYKGPRQPTTTKSRLERTCTVEDADSIIAILKWLDFSYVASVDKHRERLVGDELTAVLDQVSGLGEYAELEMLAGVDEVDAADEQLAHTLATLGLEHSHIVDATYLELILSDAYE